MKILGIDPGTFESAYMLIETEPFEILSFDKIENDKIWEILGLELDIIGIEGIVSYGMPMGNDTIQTIFWVGRMYEFINFLSNPSCPKVFIISRQDIKMTICKTVAKVNDSNIRQALIDKYGPQGTKPKPGPTYGIAGDMWSALAVCDHIISNNEENLKKNNLYI